MHAGTFDLGGTQVRTMSRLWYAALLTLAYGQQQQPEDVFPVLSRMSLENSLESIRDLPVHHYFDVQKGTYRVGIMGESVAESHPNFVKMVDKKILLGSSVVSLGETPSVDVSLVFTHALAAGQLLAQRAEQIRLATVAAEFEPEFDRMHRLEDRIRTANWNKPQNVSLRRETFVTQLEVQRLKIDSYARDTKAKKEALALLGQERSEVHIKHHEILSGFLNNSYAFRAEMKRRAALGRHANEEEKDVAEEIGMLVSEFENRFALLEAEQLVELDLIQTKHAELAQLERLNEPNAERLLQAEQALAQKEMNQIIETLFSEASLLFRDLFGDVYKLYKLSAAFMGFIVLYALALELAPALRFLWARMTRKSILSAAAAQSRSMFTSSVMLDAMVLTSKAREVLGEIALAMRIKTLGGSRLPFVLFHGEPGTGKTLAARSVATDSRLQCAVLCAADLLALGTKAGLHLRQLLHMAETGRRPTVVIIDEADVILSDRASLAGTMSLPSSCLYALLHSMREGHTNLAIIITTRKPIHEIDSAFLDRIDQIVSFDLPNAAQRLDFILSRCLSRLRPCFDPRTMAEFDMVQESKKSILAKFTDMAESVGGQDETPINRDNTSPETDRPVQIYHPNAAFSRLVEGHLKGVALKTSPSDPFEVVEALVLFLLSSHSWSFRDLDKFSCVILSAAVSTESSRASFWVWVTTLLSRVAEHNRIVTTSLDL